MRTLKQGQTLTVAISPNDLFDIPASSADVTLTALKQADRLPQGEHLKPEVAERGMTFVCLEFKVTNVSTEKFDTSHLTEARWTGKDGEAKKVDQEIGAHCAGLGLVKENLLSAPDPRPGEFVRGTTCSRYLTVRRVSWSSPTSRTTPCSRPRRPPSVEALECPERVTGMGPIRRLRRVRLASP